MLKNLVCLDGSNFTLVPFTKDYRVHNLLFIIADTKQKRLYCYTKLALEEIYRQRKLEIQGIVFSTTQLGKIVDWKNTTDNGIIEINTTIRTRNIGDAIPWNHIVILDKAYLVKQFYQGLYFYYDNMSVCQVTSDTSRPCLFLDGATNTNANIVTMLSKYPQSIKVSIQGYKNKTLSLDSLEWSCANLSSAFLNDTIKDINFGKLHLEKVSNLTDCFTNCNDLHEIDFSSCVNDILVKAETKESDFRLFNLATIANLNTQQVIIYLNKDTSLFNKRIVESNPYFKVIGGVIPNSQRERLTKLRIGKEILMNTTLTETAKIKGFIVLVDTTL